MRGTHIPMAFDLVKMRVNMTNAIDKAGINGRQSLCIPRPAIAKKGTRLYMSSVSNNFSENFLNDSKSQNRKRRKDPTNT